MAGRLLDVTAYTTLDYVEASAYSSDWSENGTAVLDVRTPKDTPETVALDLELDPTAVDAVESHAHSVSLTTEQAETLIAALKTAIEDDGSDRPARLQK